MVYYKIYNRYNMDDLDKFCNIVKNRSEENAKTIKLLYENKLYGNCVVF